MKRQKLIWASLALVSVLSIPAHGATTSLQAPVAGTQLARAITGPSLTTLSTTPIVNAPSSSTFTGVLPDSNSVATYTFNVDAGLFVTVSGYDGIDPSLNENAVDPFLYLFDPSGNLVAFDDDSGGGTEALIGGYIAPVSGTYSIIFANGLNRPAGFNSVSANNQPLSGGGFAYGGTPILLANPQFDNGAPPFVPINVGETENYTVVVTTAVPEPSPLLPLLGMGLGIFGWRRAKAG